MGASMSEQMGDSQREKRRVTVTQLLRSPVLDATGDQVGRVEDFIAKLTDGGYPPITGLKVGVGGHDVFVGRKVIEKLEPGAVRLNTNTIDMTAFQRRKATMVVPVSTAVQTFLPIVLEPFFLRERWASAAFDGAPIAAGLLLALAGTVLLARTRAVSELAAGAQTR